MRLIILFFCVLCITCYSQHGADTLQASRYSQLADSFHKSTAYDSSVAYLRKAAALYEKAKAWQRAANCYNRIADNYTFMAETNLSLKAANEALEICSTRLNLEDKEAAEAYDNLGTGYTTLGRYEIATTHFEKALAIRKKLFGDDHPAMAESYGGIAQVFYLLGDLDQALSYLNDALAIDLKTHGADHPNVAGDYNNIGVLYNEMGQFDLALSYYNKALTIAIKAFGENHPHVASTYNNIGFIYKRKEDYIKALNYYNKSFNAYRGARETLHDALAYNNIAAVYREKGDYALALDLFHKALNIRLRELNESHPLVANTYSNIGGVYEKMQEYDKALDYYRRGMERITVNLGKRHQHVASTYISMGSAYEKTGNFVTAIENYQKGLIANTTNFSSLSASENPDIGECLNRNILLQALTYKGRALQKLYLKSKNKGDLKSSLATYQLADSLVRKIRQSRQHYNDKITASKMAAELYEGGIQACMAMHAATADDAWLSQAFYYSERNKAGILRDALSDISAKSFGTIPAELLVLEKNLHVSMAYYQSEIQKEMSKKSGYDTARVKQYEGLVFDMTRRADSLTGSFERSYPAYYALKYQDEIPGLEAIQDALPKEAILIEYFEGDSMIYIFSASRTSRQLRSVKRDSVFNNTIQGFVKSIKENQSAVFSRYAYKAYQLLLKDVLEQYQNVSQLIIIPDGALCTLPFEALVQTPPGAARGYKDLNYLLNDFQVSYHYSVAFLGLNKARHGEAKTFIGYAPAAVADRQDYLPGSKREVERIASFFKGEAVTGEYATEGEFKKTASNFDIIHVASHTAVNDEEPLYSRLYFTKQDSIEDGILHTYELYNLDINADLVTLSACNTGVGKFHQGEGMMSIARGFMYAGSPNIVMSLWKVSDEPTTDIMLFFYEEIEKGTPYAEALRKAKVRYIEEGDNVTANPNYWSAFVFIGTAEKETYKTGWIWIICSVGLAGILMVLIRRRKN